MFKEGLGFKMKLRELKKLFKSKGYKVVEIKGNKENAPLIHVYIKYDGVKFTLPYELKEFLFAFHIIRDEIGICLNPEVLE